MGGIGGSQVLGENVLVLPAPGDELPIVYWFSGEIGGCQVPGEIVLDLPAPGGGLVAVW